MLKYNFFKHLITFRKKVGGRNFNGRITVRYRGGGHRKLYRKINFDYSSKNFKILSFEYDPNRNALINAVRCLDSLKFDYILANNYYKVGNIINTSEKVDFGGRYFLKDLPPNFVVSNIEFNPLKGGQIARSSGMFCKILQKNFKSGRVRLKMPSLEERFVNMNCKANAGPILNTFFHLKKLKKAGNSRWLGKRPRVRGVAMNPIDHPHGGGQGKTSGGRPSVTPWGRITIGQPTRAKRSRTNSLIYSRRKQF